MPAISRYAESGVHRMCPECEEDEMQRQAVAGNKEVKETNLPLMRQPEKEEEEKLQRQVGPGVEEVKLQAEAGAGEARLTDGATEGAIRALQGGGQPLPESVRAYIEPRMGDHFSGVQIHTDGHAGPACAVCRRPGFHSWTGHRIWGRAVSAGDERGQTALGA